MASKRRVVITGMGAVTCLGVKVDNIWDKMLNKQSGISLIEKFDATNYACRIAGEIKDFDPAGIPPRDLRRLDLFSQYALVAAQSAVEDSQLDFSKENPDQIGVILGSGMGGMTEVESQEEVLRQKGPRRISPFFVPKLMINAAAAEISIRYGLEGINHTTSSACASSAHAIGHALRTVQYGDADVVVSGGSEAVIVPLGIAGFCSARALSKRNDAPDKASRPFDKDRDGFVMGEGAAIIILEELEHARARGAKIYAEVMGVGWNADAYHVTQPSPEGSGAKKVMESALRDAQLAHTQIDYINAHGTSTRHNDKIETLAIKRVFGDRAYQIPISSSKSMVGHSLGAAGAIEAMVTALSIYHRQIHATANYETPDPECDLDYVPGDARELSVQYAISNSFGFGGHNVCLIFGKSPAD